MRKIFVSYRQKETGWVTGRIVDRLNPHYGKESIFIDIDNISVGTDFRQRLNEVLQECDLMIAIVGPQWMGSLKITADVERENDWVRYEIAEALKRDILVIPTLVDGAEMPKPGDLPDDLKDFAYRHAASMSGGKNFDANVEQLIRDIDQAVADSARKSLIGNVQSAPALPEKEFIEGSFDGREQPDASAHRSDRIFSRAEGRNQLRPFRDDNAAYEAWLATQCNVVTEDIKAKHRLMKNSAFMFLRATYFRWARQIGTACPELMDAPRVLGVGDVHLENFGTWRDAEGRLVWGVNDFDEAAVMPYVLDLVRLAASIRLSPDRAIDNREVAAALLKGYLEGLQQPQPALLDEGETWLRPYAIGSDLESGKFWKKVDKYEKAAPPPAVVSLLEESLPKEATNIHFRVSIAGGGGLGRPRYVAIADWRGGRVLREAKALVPSAWTYVHGKQPSGLLELAKSKYRAPDPFLDIRDKFIVRRLAPDSRKIELDQDDASHLKIYFVQAMAFDLASIHAAGSVGVAALRRDLERRPRDWLHQAAKSAAAAVEQDFEDWCG